MKILKICAKCSDMFSASLIEDGKNVGNYYGYVPEFFPGDCGDYIVLEIDIDTGQIKNWRKPTKKQLQKHFNSKICGTEGQDRESYQVNE